MTSAAKKDKFRYTVGKFRRQFAQHVFVWLGIIFMIIFAYIPMCGIILAFKDYSFTKGIFGSPWIGLENYVRMFQNPMVWNALKNTIVISLQNILICFPAPILLALLLNEIRNTKFKKTVQTISYLPYFVSWVIVVAILNALLRGDGLFNSAMIGLGLRDEPYYFLQEPSAFYPIIILSDLWKGIGWNTIIYLSSIASVNPEVVEASIIDGASRPKQVWHVILPAIRETIVILFIFRMSGLLNTNFDQIYLLQNPLVVDVSETLDTYVFKVGVGKAQYSFATAVGLLKSVVGFGLLMLTNFVSKKLTDEGVF